ncbi:MAG: DUF1365 domain-containing protein [Acidimicrobiia bacterium]
MSTPATARWTSHPSVAAYAGTVAHRRVSPERTFTPKLFLSFVDVDALPGSLDPVPGWSARRWAVVRYHRADFFDGSDRPLGDAVRDLVAARIGRRPTGRVDLLAHLRTAGWLFNPLAVYYCWTPDGDALDALVLEVTNTPWGERHWYVIDATLDSPVTTPKAMHVSPFLPMDLDYRISWTSPGPTLRLTIAVERAGTPVLTAGLDLHRVDLDSRHAVGLLVRHPLLPLRVTLGIRRQALVLFLRRVRRFRHPAPTPTQKASTS